MRLYEILELDELEIRKDIKNIDIHQRWPGQDLLSILKKYDWKIIGSGAEACVLEHPEKKYVLKLFPKNSNYIKFVEYVQNNQDNLHLPKFSRFIQAIPDTDWLYVRMEKLQKTNYHQLVTNYLPELCVFVIVGIQKHIYGLSGIMDKEIKREYMKKGFSIANFKTPKNIIKSG